MSVNARHRAILLALPLALAIVLRLYPYFFSGIPWGTDAWPVIRNANELLAHSPTSLGGNPIFDSYNIYWPGVSLFGAGSSLVFGAEPIQVMPIVIPLVASFSTLFFFLMVEKLAKNSLVACIASLFFASAGFDAIFTASATKETFAFPLFMLALLLLLLKPEWKNISLFVVVSIALALSHHVTMIILLAVAGAFVIAKITFSLAGYGKLGRVWILPAAVGIIFIAYVEIYARTFLSGAAIGFAISVDSLTPLLAFFFASIVLAVYFSFAKKLRFVLIGGLLLLGSALSLLFLSTRTSIIPFAPALPKLVAALALPYLLVGFFAVPGYRAMHEKRDSFVFAASWLAATLALLGYALIGTPNGVFIIYRFFTFAYAPVAVFGGFGIVIFLNGRDFKIARKLGAALIIISIVIASSYMSYASVVGKENLLAGHYAYARSDFASAQFVSRVLPPNATLAADSMIGDLYTGYFLVGVNPDLGYKYLEGLEHLGINSSVALVTYSLMDTQGYDLFLYGFPVPSNYYGSFSKNSSLVYDNGNELIWR